MISPIQANKESYLSSGFKPGLAVQQKLDQSNQYLPHNIEHTMDSAFQSLIKILNQMGHYVKCLM